MRTLIILPLLAILASAETVRVNLPSKICTAGVWRLSNAFAEVPQGATSPKLMSAVQECAIKAHPGASVSVSFGIDEKGIPFNIRIVKSSDKQLDEEVIALIREWRFEAALRDGLFVQSHAFLDLSSAPDPLDGQPRPVRRLK
jgi:TonB family protein